MTEAALSRNGVLIRLTDERWAHIVEEHAELAGLRAEVLEVVTHAEQVVEGQAGELLGFGMVDADHALVVVDREASENDGFIITAFLTSQVDRLARRSQRWPPQR